MATDEMPSFGNRYVVRKQLGSGGMAEVYQAVDTTLDRIVAIKVMLPQLAGDPSFTRRFKTEAKAAARMSSAYVVNIYDWGEGDEGCYIVMEYVRGIDLMQALKTRGPLHPVKVAEISSQACSALQEAKRHNIVHRDIKPSNIMMQTTGDIKLMDFGIAQASDATTMSSRGVMGTAAYMSPEQLRGRTVTTQSDLYSLGASMYELCTGVLPFTAVSGRPGDSDTPLPPHLLSADLDEELSAIILKAMEPKLSDRYQEPDDMKADLDDYLSRADELEPASDFPQVWALAFTEGPDDLKGDWTVFDRPLLFGRAHSATLKTSDPSVSAKHALFTPRGKYLQVDDLVSANGTIVNGEPASRTVLCEAGATVEMGACKAIVGKR